jgi:transposase InsO family protein
MCPASAGTFWLEEWEKQAIIAFHEKNPLERYRRLTFMMTEANIEIILERAKEQYLEAKPRIMSGNGPQFIAKDFKEFIRISGMTYVRTSPQRAET